jgi:aspartyl protease family protein
MTRPRTQTRYPLLLKLLLAFLALALVVLFARHETLGLENADFGRLAALFAILVFVGAGVMGRSMRPGEIVRAIVGWLAIIVVLVAAYASRDQLAAIAGRFVGALVPGAPITGRLAGESDPDSVVVIRSGDGHFEIRAEVDDRPVSFLLDTGATFVTLTHEDAIRIGIAVDALSYDTPIRTANGPVTAASVTVDRLAVGPLERRGVKALVAHTDVLDKSLLGLSFLNTLGGYSIAGDRLVLKP